jgi:hypothetical protein
VTDENKDLTPEQEAVVGEFVSQLNGGVDGKPMVSTPAGLIPITPEQNERIQQAAVDRIIQAIRKEQPSLSGRIVRDLSGICFGAVILSGTAYVVWAAARAIFGG